MKVGDLVVVVKPRPCCGSLTGMGRVFRIAQMGRFGWECDECGVADSTALYARIAKGKLGGNAVVRLRVIPPLQDLEKQVDEMEKVN